MKSVVDGLTVKGKTVRLASQGPDGRIFGWVPGEFTATWWRANGQHNTYPCMALTPETLEKFNATQKEKPL